MSLLALELAGKSATDPRAMRARERRFYARLLVALRLAAHDLGVLPP